jgi:hypothetical protein
MEVVMIAAATRQDLQGALEYAKNSIIEKMVSRGYMQSVVDQVRMSILQSLHELHAENQQFIRQSQLQRDQLITRLLAVEQEVRVLRQLTVKMLEQQNKTMNMLLR